MFCYLFSFLISKMPVHSYVYFFFLLASCILLGSASHSWYNITGHLQGLDIASEMWVPMNESEALYYFTAHEVCGLFSQGRNCDNVVPNHMKECSAYYGGVVHNNNPCSNYYGAFLRHISTKPWPRGKLIIDLVRVMKHHDANTLFLIGKYRSVKQFYILAYIHI